MQNTVRFRGHQTIRHPRSFQYTVFWASDFFQQLMPLTFYETINLDGLVKSLHPHNGLKTNGIQDESA
jgi:hypothetical protein